MTWRVAAVAAMLAAGCATAPDAVREKTSGGVSPRGRIRVACIGDSITWGYAMTNRVEECYPAQLQRILGDGYEVLNFGDPGAGVYREPKRGPSGWLPHPWPTGAAVAAYDSDPDIVVSNLGINDASIYMYEYEHGDNGVAKTEPGLFRRQYVDLLEKFRKGGRSPRVIMWTRLAPAGRSHRLYGRPDPFVMARDLDLVAREVGAEPLDMYTPLVPYVETPHYARDGIHPEGGAQRVIAEITAAAILSPPKPSGR